MDAGIRHWHQPPPCGSDYRPVTNFDRALFELEISEQLRRDLPGNMDYLESGCYTVSGALAY